MTKLMKSIGFTTAVLLLAAAAAAETQAVVTGKEFERP
jgi:hypothetical protein